MLLGLGHTVPELNITEYSKHKFEKLQFSMMVPELVDHLKTELKHVRLYAMFSFRPFCLNRVIEHNFFLG